MDTRKLTISLILPFITAAIINCQSSQKNQTGETSFAQGKDYKTIYIHNFSNSTYDGSLIEQVNRAIIQSFSMDKRFHIESQKSDADLWLFGNIDLFLINPRGYDQFGQPRSYTMTLLLSIWVSGNIDRKSDDDPDLIMEKKTIRYDLIYTPSPPVYDDEFIVKERLCQGIANRVLKTVLTGWYSELKNQKELGYEKGTRKTPLNDPSKKNTAN